MENSLKKTFIDVRRAFRLIYELQRRINDIVYYIKEQTYFENCVGIKRFSREISNRKQALDDYAKLKLFKDMWAWDFIYGYQFEFYFGNLQIDNLWASMSVLQISDDGFAISKKGNKEETETSTFESAENSESYFLFMISCAEKVDNFIWLKNNDIEDEQYIDYFLSSGNEFQIEHDGQAKFIIKKYPMERFSTQSDTDFILNDFADLVYKECGIKILKHN